MNIYHLTGKRPSGMTPYHYETWVSVWVSPSSILNDYY